MSFGCCEHKTKRCRAGLLDLLDRHARICSRPQYSWCCSREDSTQQLCSACCRARKGNTCVLLSVSKQRHSVQLLALQSRYVQIAFTLTSLRSSLLPLSVLRITGLHKPPVTRLRVPEYSMAVASAVLRPRLSCQRLRELGGRSSSGCSTLVGESSSSSVTAFRPIL